MKNTFVIDKVGLYKGLGRTFNHALVTHRPQKTANKGGLAGTQITLQKYHHPLRAVARYLGRECQLGAFIG
jgi:hypothetical protein